MKQSFTLTFIMTLIGVFTSVSLYADDKQSGSDTDHISVNTACENALEFINSLKATGHHGIRKAPMKQADLTLSAERPNMYIFNVGTSEGFVVASACSVTRPILCYSTDGQWDDNSMQQALGWLFEQYDTEIANIKKNRARAANGSISKSPIDPLIKTRWHQDAPYNNKLTAFSWDGNTYHVKTGCVATAMAQIMNYHQWPKTIKQTIPAVNHGQVIGEDATEVIVNEVPAGTVIDWKHMNAESIWIDSDPAIINAISSLMSYCGTAVRMYYGEFDSSSHNLSAMYALKHYFDYDPTIYIADRSNFSYYDWCNMLYDELRAGRPILYNGQSNYGGHSFIIDGYDGNEMFHFNLGWNQKTSVYAILSSVGHDSAIDNPDAYDSPDGYVFHQTAVMNIQKSGLSTGTYHVSLTSNYYFQSENTVSCTYYNNEDEGYTFDLGIGYRDNDGNIQVAKAIEGVNIAAASSNTQQYKASSLNMAKGTYHLLPIARLSGGLSEWQFVSNELDYQVAKVSSKGKVTFTEHKRLANLTAEAMTFSGHSYAGQELYVFCNIKNNGEEDFFDKLYFFWNDNPANKGIEAGHYLLWSHATVNAGGTAPVEFYFTPERAGDYTVWVTTDAAGENVVGQAEVTVGKKMPYQVNNDTPITLSNIKVANLQNGVILGNDVVVDFDATNTSKKDYYYGFVDIGVILYQDGYSQNELYPDGIIKSYEIAPGQTRHFQFGIPNVQPDYDVSIKLLIGSWDASYTSDIYKMEQAVLAYTPDGVKTPVKAATSFTVPKSAGAVDLTMVAQKVKKVVPNSNPNTIYYLNDGDAIPEGLENHNIVFGDHSDNIVLDGTYGVAVPKQFTARSASFTKQLKKGTWSTICLPFSSSLSNKQLEIAVVTDEDVSQIHTNPTKWFNAYQTCFIRSKKDGAQTLSGSNVLFPKQNNAIVTLNNYKSQGVMGQTTIKKVYVLNDDGTALSLKSSVKMEPFTSFFVVSKRGIVPSSTITLDFDSTQEVENGIIDVIASDKTPSEHSYRYNLSGQRVGHDYRGIVVVKGRKILVK